MWHNFITMTSARPLTRIYVSGEIPLHGTCSLPVEQAHHVTNVLRLAAGDALTLFDGRGVEYAAVIVRIAKFGVTLSVGEQHNVDRESHLHVLLAQAISSGDRMDYTVQKAVELGVQRIQPLASERSVVRLDSSRAEKRIAHWQAVVVAACEQCGRNRVPEVLPVLSFSAWLARGTRHDGARVMLSPHAQVKLRDLARPAAWVTLLAGPEGGLSPQEQRDAQAAGFTAVKLGPRVLRTETAAVAALAAMQVLWGDF
jgi:16S rRNA (uracil1498-N3)-methyltransferase